MAGFFTGNKKLGEAKSTHNSDYIGPGEYLARIDKCSIRPNRSGKNLAFIEMTVIDQLPFPMPDEIGENAKGQKMFTPGPRTSVDGTLIGLHPVGAAITHAVREDSDYFLSELLGFMEALELLSPSASEEEREAALNMVFDGDDNPLGGTIVHFLAKNVITKNDTDFTRIGYKGEVSPAEAIKRLDPDVVERFFPNGALSKLAEAGV